MEEALDVVKKVWYRVYSDFLLPNRLHSWRLLLEEALRAEYEVLPLNKFWRKITKHELHLNNKYLILRHDIDTDISTARAMWDIERSLQIASTYFFRLSTWDNALMNEIQNAGGEASYHYEELSTYAKVKGLCDDKEVLSQLQEIREQFAENIESLRKSSGLPLNVVASHGDWINRHLGIPNHVILNDRSFREQTLVQLEAYDGELLNKLSLYFSDTLYPTLWIPRKSLSGALLKDDLLHEPVDAIRKGVPILHILVHPRHWRANAQENLVDDIKRTWEWVDCRAKSAFRTVRR